MKTDEKVRVLSVHDRCDGCGAQAYVQVKGVSGELTLCVHHYDKIMRDDLSKKALESFSYEVVDERDFL